MERDVLLLKDNSRIVPEAVPHDPRRFWLWGSFACVEWPRELIIEAFLAWEDLSYRKDSAKLLRFLQNYEEWWTSPEGEKLRRMDPCQADSPARTHHLSQAREAARPQS